MRGKGQIRVISLHTEISAHRFTVAKTHIHTHTTYIHTQTHTLGADESKTVPFVGVTRVVLSAPGVCVCACVCD